MQPNAAQWRRLAGVSDFFFRVGKRETIKDLPHKVKGSGSPASFLGTPPSSHITLRILSRRLISALDAVPGCKDAHPTASKSLTRGYCRTLPFAQSAARNPGPCSENKCFAERISSRPVGAVDTASNLPGRKKPGNGGRAVTVDPYSTHGMVGCRGHAKGARPPRSGPQVYASWMLRRGRPAIFPR